MTVQYVDLEDAVNRDGLRMVVVGNVPSPWGEAAKGILHIKGIDWVAVRLDYENPLLKTWAGRRSGPVAIYNNEPPRHAWADILMLAERLAPTPSLLPADPEERALAFGLAHELSGEGGLGWCRRLQMIDAGLNGKGGFPEAVAKYLGRKYGHSPDAADHASRRVAELLRMFAARLHRQHQDGRQYYVGDAVTVVDVYSATVMALFDPLPDVQCNIDARTRRTFETRDETTTAALDPVLIQHRDMMFRDILELPLSL